MEEVLLTLVEKTLVTFVQLALVTCLFTTCTFDMWMLARVHNMLSWCQYSIQQLNVAIDLFEAIKIRGVDMALKLRALLDKFSFTKKIIVYVKNKGFNL